MFSVPLRFMNDFSGSQKAGRPRTPVRVSIWTCPTGNISIDSVAAQKGVITHFAVAVDHMDRVAAKRLADKINSAVPGAKARDASQTNTGGSTVNLRDPDGLFVQISSKDGR